MDNIFADRGGDETAENDCGHGIHNLLAGLLAAKDQRDETEGRHEYGGEAFEAASQDHRFCELFALLFHQVQVASNEQDAVSRRDATQRNETDTGREWTIVVSGQVFGPSHSQRPMVAEASNSPRPKADQKLSPHC